MKHRPGIRIETNGMIGSHAKIFYVNENGAEIDISSSITHAWVRIGVGEINLINLEAILVDGKIHGTLDQVELTNVNIAKK